MAEVKKLSVTDSFFLPAIAKIGHLLAGISAFSGERKTRE
jgi:hypothetical protein